MGELRFKIPPSVYDIKENKKENSITKILENIVARSIQVLKAAIGPCSSFRDDDFSGKLVLLRVQLFFAKMIHTMNQRDSKSWF